MQHRLAIVLILSLCCPTLADDKPAPEGEKLVRRDLYGDPLPPGAIARLGTVGPRSGRPNHIGEVARLVFSPDGQTLASRCHEDRTARIWDSHTGRQLQVLPGGETYGYPLTFAPDGRTLACGYWDGTIRFWDQASGKEVRRFVIDGEARAVDALQFSPDGRTLATSSYQGGKPGQVSLRSIILWELATGKQLVREDKSVVFQPSDAAFSPDVKFLAFDDGQEIVLWDVARKRERLRLKGSGQDRITRIAFSPDGRIVAATCCKSGFEDFTLRLSEVITGKELLRIPTTDSIIFSLAFSPDGRVVAWGNAKAVRLWDIATGQECLRHQGHKVQVCCLAFSPDGKALASGQKDSTALIWDAAPHTRQAGMPSRDLGPKDLEQLWADLGSEEAPKAHRAIWTLVAAREKAVAMFKGHLQAAFREDPKPIHQLIADLDSSRFTVREQASQQLERLILEAESALLKALEDNPSAERRRRIEALLTLPRIVHSPEALRQLRGIQVLEQVGSPEARQVLERLAKGAPEARLTQEAKASLERLQAAG